MEIFYSGFISRAFSPSKEHEVYKSLSLPQLTRQIEDRIYEIGITEFDKTGGQYTEPNQFGGLVIARIDAHPIIKIGQYEITQFTDSHILVVSGGRSLILDIMDYEINVTSAMLIKGNAAKIMDKQKANTP